MSDKKDLQASWFRTSVERILKEAEPMKVQRKVLQSFLNELPEGLPSERVDSVATYINTTEWALWKWGCKPFFNSEAQPYNVGNIVTWMSDQGQRRRGKVTKRLASITLADHVHPGFGADGLVECEPLELWGWDFQIVKVEKGE